MNSELPDITALKAEKSRRSFHFFFKEFWEIMSPGTFLIDNWHIKYLCDELQDVATRAMSGKPKKYDIIINVPPGSSKSSIASVALPAWMWTVGASAKVIAGSNAQPLALNLSVKARDIIQSEKYKLMFPAIIMKEDVNNKSQYGNIHGGMRISTSVGSSVIGHHAHLIIIDDPLPLNPSTVAIDNANMWLDSLSTRKVDKDVTPLILIMQRLAENDTTGYMLGRGGKVHHICLPAIATSEVSPPEALELYKDNLLDPHRLSFEILEDARSQLGSANYEAQFLQSPSPAGGGIIKHNWIRKMHGADEVTQKLIEGLPVHFFVDGAYTEDKTNDPSAILAAAYDVKSNSIYVLKAAEFWMEWNEIVKFIQDVVKRYGSSISKVYIEPKANGLSLQQYLKKHSPLNIPRTKSPKTSKDERLNAVSPFIEGGKVIFIEGHDSYKGVVMSNMQEVIHEITHQKPKRYGVRDTLVMAIDELMSNMNKGRYIPRSNPNDKKRYNIR